MKHEKTWEWDVCRTERTPRRPQKPAVRPFEISGNKELRGTTRKRGAHNTRKTGQAGLRGRHKEKQHEKQERANNAARTTRSMGDMEEWQTDEM